MGKTEYLYYIIILLIYLAIKIRTDRGKNMLEQTQILKAIFTKTQNDIIYNIIEDIKIAGANYKTIELWKFDQSLGGIGGYCQGCDPANSNPFQGSIYRNIYKCFQYIRADIDILNINYTARDIIENCGHHFEEVIKIYLKFYKKLEFLRTREYPLGKLLKYTSNKNIFERELIEEVKLFINLYNISKHEILSNDQLDRTFHLDDAIICYFASKIVGKKILMLIDSEKCQETYKINWEKYGKNINRF